MDKNSVLNSLEIYIFPKPPWGPRPSCLWMGSSDLTHSLRFITLGTKGEQECPEGKNLVQSHTEKVLFFFSDVYLKHP